LDPELLKRRYTWTTVVRPFVDGLPSKEVVFLSCDDPRWEESQLCGPSGKPFVVRVLPFDSKTGTVFPISEFRDANFRGHMEWVKIMEACGVTFTEVPTAMRKVCKKKG